MTQNKDSGRDKLLQELENLKDTLSSNKKRDQEDNVIPTLEEVVGHEKTIQQRKENPFLSSETLAQLISKRNDAEAKAAEELAQIIRQHRVTPSEQSSKPMTPSLFDFPVSAESILPAMTDTEAEKLSIEDEMKADEEFIFPREEIPQVETNDSQQHQLTAEDLLEQLHQELGDIIQGAIDKVLPSFVQKIEMEVMLKLEELIIEQSNHHRTDDPQDDPETDI